MPDEEGKITKEEVYIGFMYAADVLHELNELGFVFPQIKLFHDASGVVSFSQEGVTTSMLEQAQNLVGSARPVMGGVDVGDIGIQFSHGLIVKGAEKYKNNIKPEGGK